MQQERREIRLGVHRPEVIFLFLQMIVKLLQVFQFAWLIRDR